MGTSCHSVDSLAILQLLNLSGSLCNFLYKSMGFLACSTVVVLLVSLVIGYVFYTIGQVPQVPDIQVQYWGPGAEKPDNKAIKPFKINISDLELKSLQEKLGSTRPLVPPLEGVAFNYGINTEYLNSFVEFWKTKYNWRDREAYLNSLPQFVTQIGGLNIHYIHAKPEATKVKGKIVLPLLLIHGWPGSVREFYDLIPMVTSPRPDAAFVFEVIAPSLPGYAFSQGASKPGLGPAQMGALFNELMTRLGFQKYYIQGGDWGSVIGKTISVIYPQRVIGYHSNFCSPGTLSSKYRTLLAYLFPSFFVKENMQQTFKEQFFDTLFLETGYLLIHATKPDTVGVALTDSPVGLAAYILEKFSTWTNKAHRNLPNGGLDAYNKVELLDNIMIYWFTNSITTSVRLYSEAFCKKSRNLEIDSIPVMVPTACAVFRNEMLYYPTIALEGSFENLVSVSEVFEGGHFAALEVPKTLADDVFAFVKAVRVKAKGKK